MEETGDIFFKRLNGAGSGAGGTAIKPSVATALRVIKSTIPITLGVAILCYFGVAEWISALSPCIILAMISVWDQCFIIIFEKKIS